MPLLRSRNEGRAEIIDPFTALYFQPWCFLFNYVCLNHRGKRILFISIRNSNQYPVLADKGAGSPSHWFVAVRTYGPPCWQWLVLHREKPYLAFHLHERQAWLLGKALWLTLSTSPVWVPSQVFLASCLTEAKPNHIVPGTLTFFFCHSHWLSSILEADGANITLSIPERSQDAEAHSLRGAIYEVCPQAGHPNPSVQVGFYKEPIGIPLSDLHEDSKRMDGKLWAHLAERKMIKHLLYSQHAAN